MPTYGYECEQCHFDFETEQCFSEDALKVCPECGEASLVKKIYVPFIFIKGEPTTVGHQAARNTEKMGKYEYDSKIQERQKRIRQASENFLKETAGQKIEHSGELPWWRSGQVEGLPKKERPISMKEAEKLAKEVGIKVHPPQPKPKKD
jgi:putative FmdB family regulatory protein